MSFLFVDSQTWTITLLGWAIVLVALFFLVGIFLVIPKIINWSIKRSLRNKGKHQIKDEHLAISGETNAAIATALFLYFNQIHDEESNVITIKQVRRRYSPWNSKLYGMTNMDFRR